MERKENGIKKKRQWNGMEMETEQNIAGKNGNFSMTCTVCGTVAV